MPPEQCPPLLRNSVRHGPVHALGLMLVGARRRALLSAMGLEGATFTAEEQEFFEFSLLAQGAALGRTRLPRPFDDAALASLTVPVRVVVGGRDIYFDALAVRRRIETLVPDAVVRFLPTRGMGSSIRPIWSWSSCWRTRASGEHRRVGTNLPPGHTRNRA